MVMLSTDSGNVFYPQWFISYVLTAEFIYIGFIRIG